MKHDIFAIGDNALTVDFGNEILSDLNDFVLSLNHSLLQNPFHGFIETVPAYASLTIFYDLQKVREVFPQFPTAFDGLCKLLENLIENLKPIAKSENRLIEIPVFYGKDVAPDLEFIAEIKRMTPEDVIRIHLEKVYRVFMLGFLPGFAYMGEVDDRIAVPRKEIPRTKIKKGSVGIAGKQTGIYPLDSPGGWQIIGKTPLNLFKPENEEISVLRSGDLVKFYRI